MTPHKRRDLIIAFADGHEIQYQSLVDGNWYHCDIETLVEADGYEFRIKPKPDVVAYTTYERWAEGQTARTVWQLTSVEGTGNLKLTFCGESGKLKAAEVL